ncbi:hypothetical protein UT300005_16960 [Clostridium sp. CTA-5]
MQIKNNNRIPGPGDNSNLFERLSSYISIVDKDWINRIKPASKESISLLRKLSGIEDAGLDFPEAYKIFLKYMGKSDGSALGQTLLGDISIEDIIDLYKEINEYEPNTLNPQYLTFVSTHLGGEISFDLSQPNNPNIVMTSSGEFCYFFSESFEKLLFQYTFLKYEELYYPKAIFFGGSENRLRSALDNHKTTNIFDVVDRYAKKNGFEKVWFSDQRHYFGIREDATFYVRSDSNVVGNITGDNCELLDEFGTGLASEIGARIQR